MEKFANTSFLSSNKWDEIIYAFKVLTNEGININDFLPGQTYHNIPVGDYLEEIRQLRCAGKLTKEEVDSLKMFNIYNEYFKYRWLYMYKKAKNYFLTYGHLQVKKSENIELYYWVADQRKRFRGANRSRPNGVIDKYSPHSEEQRKLLEEIDIDWDVSAFNKYYPLLLKYYTMRGNLDIPNPCWIDGHEIGHWVYAIQTGRGKLTEEQKSILSKLNFEFKYKGKDRHNSGTSFPEQAVFFYFRKVYNKVENRIKIDGFELDMYSEENGIAIEYDGLMWHKTKRGISNDNKKDELCKEKGIKLIRIREEGLPRTESAINYFVPSNIELLDQPLKEIFGKELGVPDMSIDIKRDFLDIQDYYLNLESIAINRHIKELIEYKEQHGSFPPPNKNHSGLYGFVLQLRNLKKGRGGRLTAQQIQRLDEIGMIWDHLEYDWEVGYNHAHNFYLLNNNLNVPYNYKSTDGYRLGNWIINQRHRRTPEKTYRGKLLTVQQIQRLDEIGMIW